MHKRFRAAGSVFALTLAGAVATAMTASATPAHDRTPSPSMAARSAGIAHPGQAYMGWSAPGHGKAATPRQQYRSLSGAPSAKAASATTGPQGIDVSSWQKNVDWRYWWNQGMQFAYVKATEGNYYTNEYFAQQYNGSYNVGMIRGAYHFANPSVSSGKNQATYFARHGGGWSADGRTLPGVLDIEYNPYGGVCYGKSKKQMRNWISAFVRQYKKETSRDAVIYTTFDWWKRCTGNTTMFNNSNPLWVARYASTPGTLPGQWPYYTFWQYTASPIDTNKFNGTYSRLKALARG